MAQVLFIHPDNPQQRLIKQAVDSLNRGGVIVYPTDTAYALACHLDDKQALDRIKQIRRLNDKHLFTLLCQDLAHISHYAKVDNWQYRLLKANTPGEYTFILPASTAVPRRLLHPKRRTIGIRVPSNTIAQELLEAMGEPLITTTLQIPDSDTDLYTDADDIVDIVGNQVDVIINGGYGKAEETTVVSLLEDAPELIREGSGAIEPLGL